MSEAGSHYLEVRFSEPAEFLGSDCEPRGSANLWIRTVPSAFHNNTRFGR